MSVRLPSGGARRDDDELLDRLGRGEPVDGGEVERLLYTWRASMPSAGRTDERLIDAVVAAVARPPRGHGRARKVTATVAAAALLVGGGLTAVAAQAGPGSPLWPVTELVFGGMAESRAALESADVALRDAKVALDQGRIPEATRLLARADELADKVHEPGAADRLRDDIASLRALLDRDVAAGAQARTDITGRDTSSPGTAPSATAPSPTASSPTATGDPPPERPAPDSTAEAPPTTDRPFDAPSVETPTLPQLPTPSRSGRPGPPGGPGEGAPRR